MLSQNNASELELIPFVMVLAEYEQNYEENPYIEGWGDDNISDLAYGMGPQRISWQQVGECAFKALGGYILDLLKDAIKSLGGKLTKSVIKQAFKMVAKKVLGPVSIMFTVLDFGICLATS